MEISLDIGKTDYYRLICNISKPRIYAGMFSEYFMKKYKNSGFDTLDNMIKFKNLSGETIRDQYQVQELLGAGGMGDVYKAFDTRSSKFVALKRMVAFREREHLEKRFRQEVSFLEAVESPYVVELYDDFKLDNYYFLVMEYIEGKNLHQLTKETHGTRKVLSILEILSIMSKVARGLEAIHTAGIVHRDIKPANVIVNRLQDTTKILDLGLACIEGDQLQEVSGTASYMSPEQVRGKHEAVSHLSDIFSLGATFYYVLTNQAPFQGNAVQCMVQICEKEVPSPSSLDKKIPASLSEVILKCMAKNESERFESSGKLVRALEKLRLNLLINFSQIVDQQNPMDFSETKKLSFNKLYFLNKIALLRSTDEKVRCKAIRILGRLGDTNALKPLIYLLQDSDNSDFRILRHIITALGKLASTNAIEPIKQILKHSEDEKIKKLSQKSLERMLNPSTSEWETRIDNFLVSWDKKMYKMRLIWERFVYAIRK